jgi:PAS domain S-box-containing protein
MRFDGAEPPSVEQDLRAALPDRVRTLLWVVLIASAAFLAAIASFDPRGLPRWLLFNLPGSILVIFLLSRMHQPGSVARAVAFGIILVGGVSGTAAGWAILAGDVGATALITTALCLGTAVAFPWGPSAQLLAVLVGLAAMTTNVLLVPGGLAAAGVTSVTAALVPLGASVWIARIHTKIVGRLLAREREGEQVKSHLERQLWFRTLVQQSADLYVILDRNLKVILAEGNVEQTLGYSSPSEFLGTAGATYLHPEDLDKLPSLLAEVMGEKRVAGPVEVRVRHADGSWVHIEFVARNFLDDPVIGGIVLNSRDISLRRRVELDRELLLDVARELSGTLDRDEMILRVQRRMCAALQCERAVTFFQEDERPVLNTIGNHGFLPDAASRIDGFDLPVDAPLAQALLAGRTIVADEADMEKFLPPGLKQDLATGSFLLVPLNVAGRVMGGLSFLRDRAGRAFSPAQVQLAEGVGRHLSVAIGAADLYRQQQEAAAVAGALARVGREMISSLDTPVLLSRLCQLTTEALGCDGSHTVLWMPDEEAYGIVAGYGDTPEQSESLRLVRFPLSGLHGLLNALERDKVVQFTGPWGADGEPLTRLPVSLGITVALHVGLRRGDRLIGYQTAVYRGRRDRFSAAQERLARGIAHLGSLALENARLVEELEKADRLKSDFVANMSHELRSPLHVIIGYHEMLLERAFGPLAVEQEDALRRANRGARELLELVETTLDLSRLTAQRPAVGLQEVEIATLVDTLVTGEILINKPHLELRCEVSPDLPHVHTDRLKLRMVLKNLLGNAVKFTDSGTIGLQVSEQRGGVQFEVIDTGIGIAATDRERIFEPFVQVDGSARGRGGAGLGLYIVRRLVDLLGGTIELDSEPGRGTAVRVWMPCHPGSAQPPAAAGDEVSGLSDKT